MKCFHFILEGFYYSLFNLGPFLSRIPKTVKPGQYMTGTISFAKSNGGKRVVKIITLLLLLSLISLLTSINLQ